MSGVDLNASIVPGNRKIGGFAGYLLKLGRLDIAVDLRSHMLSTLRSLTLTLLTLTLAAAASQANETFPGVAQPDCPDPTQIGLNRCAQDWEQAALERRRDLYEALDGATFLGEPNALQTAEFTWQAFESTYCALVSQGYRGGTIYTLILDTCRAERHNERMVALTQWEPDELPDYFAVLPRLEIAYTAALQTAPLRVQAGLPSNQMLWETYREQHCDWEVEQGVEARGLSEGERLNRCFTRLTLQRIEQLRLL